MVKSKINSSVDYPIKREIDSADIGYESSIYPFRLYDKDVDIALGKPKYEFSTKYGVVYFPVYLVIADEPVSCIGVYESENNRVLSSFHQGEKEGQEEEEMELKSNQLLISVTKEYFHRLWKTHYREGMPPPPPLPIIESSDNSENLENQENKAIEEPEDESHLKLPTMIQEKTTAPNPKPIQKDSLFIDNIGSLEKIQPLPEETQEEAAQLKHQYKDASTNKWIEKFMKNNEYNILDNEGGGDCFFAVIRDAFQSIGKQTTVQKLRDLLAEEATPQLFEETRSLYLNILAEFQEKEKEWKEIKKTSILLKKRAKDAPTKADNEAILKEAKLLIDQHKTISNQLVDIKELLKEFDHMKNMDSLDKYKAFMKTSEYWADTWAISTLEKRLNIKVVIFSQESFQSGDLDSVLQCGQLNDPELERIGVFRPDFYILTNYTGNHYTLITYKQRKLFTFRELPYDIKVLVINKCMERNAGPYYLIDEFRTLKTKFGLEANHGEPSEENDEKEAEWMKKDLYDKDIVFQFYDRSDGSPKPGKGSGEQCPPSRILDFQALHRIPDWRKKLDDSWISPFTLNNKRWASVEHYFSAAQYKKGFPDFYHQFSLDSQSEVSKDVAMARAAISKSGKYKDTILRDRKVKPDPDFFEIKTEPRYLQERRVALYAKFSQNLDLKQILLETKRAKLIHFVRSREPEIDEGLMQLRKDFLSQKENIMT
jgi:hypothetical protein